MGYTINLRDADVKSFVAAVREIRNGPDRSVAIVGGAMVETALQDALIGHLHNDTRMTQELFRPSGALGAFQTKIRLAKLTGLIGAEAYSELLAMCKIRNEFAHKPLTLSFDDQPVVDWARGLKFCERYSSDTGERDEPMLVELSLTDLKWWIHDPKRDELLQTGRGRFALSVQIYTWALAGGHFTCRMPEPIF